MGIVLKQLWAPWRVEYIRRAVKDEIECFLCVYPKLNRDEDFYILFKGSYSFIILNAFPYNNGHLMIAPYRHVTSIEDLTDDELIEIFKLLKLSVVVLKSVFNPDGFNVGLNIGRAAGAGLDHLHFHVVPRWFGDTNFMPVLAETKVISQHLKETYRLLREALKNIEI